MSYKTGILLGRVSKVKGYEGTVTIRLQKPFTHKIPEMNTVFLEYEGKPVPFFISWSEYTRGDMLNVRFKGYETASSLTGLQGCRVFHDRADSEADDQKNNIDITGFRLISADKNLDATIMEVIENPGQLLIKAITTNRKELLIPFHEDLIVRVNKAKRFIIMELPEGLAEIN